MSKDRVAEQERKPFGGKDVYFSNSIQGVVNQKPDFGWTVIQYLLENGAHVLDQHVGGRNEEERDRLFLVDSGSKIDRGHEPWITVEQADVNLLDQATHVIAFVDGPSHGVGTEIQRTIDRFEFLSQRIEILCLVQEDHLPGLSWTIRGKKSPKYPIFHLKTYKELEDVKTKIFTFLTMK